MISDTITAVTNAEREYYELIQSNKAAAVRILRERVATCEMALAVSTNLDEIFVVWRSAPLRSDVRHKAEMRWYELVERELYTMTSITQVSDFADKTDFPRGSYAKALVVRRWVQLAETLDEACSALFILSGWRNRCGEYSFEKNLQVEISEILAETFDEEFSRAVTLADFCSVYVYGFPLHCDYFRERHLLKKAIRTFSPTPAALMEIKKSLKLPSARHKRYWRKLIEMVNS